MIANLDAIRCYPIKSLAGQFLTRVMVENEGLAGDRIRALTIASNHARRSKTYRGKEHDRLHLADTAAEGIELGAQRGVEVRLAQPARYFDDAPVSIITDLWMDDLASHLGYRVDYERFRPNLYLRSQPERFSANEEDLLGLRLSIGGCVLDVLSTIKRCVAVTYDHHGGSADPNILATLARERNNVLGVYCTVTEPGLIQVGDAVELRSR